MILLPQAQTLALQLLHHPIEDIDHAVGLHLPDLPQPGAEVLFLQQLHTIPDDVQRLDYPLVEKEQINHRERDERLHREEPAYRDGIEDIIRNDRPNRQQQHSEYPKQSFQPHPFLPPLLVDSDPVFLQPPIQSGPADAQRRGDPREVAAMRLQGPRDSLPLDLLQGQSR